MTDKKEIMYFGLMFEKFDILDFGDDFLAGVRANFFNSGRETQDNRSVQYINDDEFQFVYRIEDGSPLSWKVNKNGEIHQEAEVFKPGVYRVNTFNSSGRVFKRMYFDNHHVWLRCEYFDKDYRNPAYVLYPSVVEEQDVIIKIHNTPYSKVQSYLYPKSEMPENGDYSVLAFTADDFLYFNTVPNNKFISKTIIKDDAINNLGGFNFDGVDFNLHRNLNSTFDITSAEYLTEDNGNPFHKLTNEVFTPDTSGMNADDHDDDTILTDNGEEKPDYVFESSGDSYRYYGELDADKRRSGYGRTVSPLGFTAYEGMYDSDKRDGFGTFYYKDGKINYVGNWRANLRQGFGVGFRRSDGSSHIGCWNNNTPNGIGARFDSEGNFIFLGTYENGKKQGKGITLDEDGSFIISEFRDDEVIASYKLDDLLANSNDE